jgi:hypothetical protein
VIMYCCTLDQMVTLLQGSKNRHGTTQRLIRRRGRLDSNNAEVDMEATMRWYFPCSAIPWIKSTMSILPQMKAPLDSWSLSVTMVLIAFADKKRIPIPI